MSDMTHFNSENEEKMNRPMIIPSKKIKAKMCHLIAPNETIKVGTKKLKNIGSQPTLACEITDEFTEFNIG